VLRAETAASVGADADLTDDGRPGAAALRGLIERALSRAELDDTLPEEMSSRLGLCAFREAVEILHHPRPGADRRPSGIARSRPGGA